MASINEVYELLKYRATKSGYNSYVSPNDFNLIYPHAEQRYFNSKYKQYLINQANADSLIPFKTDPIAVTVDGAGKYTKPTDLLHIDSLRHYKTGSSGAQVEVVRFNDDRLANKLSSNYDAPNAEFPIYVEYKTYLQFYPITLETANLVYLQKLANSYWAYTLNATATALNTLVGGSAYTNATYTNILLTGGSGTGARATVVVSGGAVTSVTLTSGGNNYQVGDTLSAIQASLGGTGSGFSIKVSTISSSQRPVYDAANSVQPKFLDNDIDEIIYIALSDLGINMRDQQLEEFAERKIQTET